MKIVQVVHTEERRRRKEKQTNKQTNKRTNKQTQTEDTHNVSIVKSTSVEDKRHISKLTLDKQKVINYAR